MPTSRRHFLRYSLASLALAAAGNRSSAQSLTKFENPPYKRIATEEAWVSTAVSDAYAKLLAEGAPGEPGFKAMGGAIYGGGNSSRLVQLLADIGAGRIAAMDEFGIHMQLLSLTAPGVQVFDADTATALAIDSNDQLIEAIRAYPDRFAGLAAVAPQNPAGAAKEIDRGINTLGLHGVVINSHTKGEYLDDEKYWEIFEAAEAADAAIYIHPRTPSPAMLRPYLERGLELAILGFGAEVALHVVALITNGVFDRFPNLKLVIGHAGEGLPYWMYRIDYMQRNYREAVTGAKKIAALPSEYLKTNVFITSSGVAWEPAILFAQKVLGASQVMYAMDYPYQSDVTEVATSDHFDMDDATKKAFFQLNAERVFHLNRNQGST
jgi:2,3-dihydroxybenzoate decarboxylase